MSLKLFIVFGVCASLSGAPLLAQERVNTAPPGAQPGEPAELKADSTPPATKKSASSIDWIRGVTIVDGAAVYEAANFDSTVVEYIGENKQVVISRKVVRGVGGLGLFYRLKANGGKIYYITDTDIKVDRNFKERDAAPKASASSMDEPPREQKRKPSRPKRRTRVDPETGEILTPYFTRYMGGAFGMVGFSEKFSGRILSSKLPIYGFRMTGPGTIIDGPPIDFNFLFSFSAPDYYSSTFNASAAEGFLIFGDIMPMFPFYEWKDAYVYYGIGLMYTYTSYKVHIKSSVFDSQEFRVGADFGVGWATRLSSSYIIRADMKYYYEATRYLGYFLSFQMEY